MLCIFADRTELKASISLQMPCYLTYVRDNIKLQLKKGRE